MSHVMLDLETLGKAPGCVILQIGACAFDEERIHSPFTVHIDPQSCEAAGLTLDASTVMWWLGKSEAARRSLLDARLVPLDEALTLFATWFIAQGMSSRLWSKGPSFDAAILSAAYRIVRRAQPWDFRNERCVRTLLEYATPEIRAFAAAAEPNRLRHDALSDALEQARIVQGTMKHLRHV
jgi:hypothetical protein